MKYVNEKEKFWEHSYNVWLASIGGPVCVNADNAEDALDFAVDYAEERGWIGLFLDSGEIETDKDGNEIDVVRAGNHCLALPIEEIHIDQID